METVKGKTIIITGASAGVGEATAKLCAAEGANVVIAARSKKELMALAKSLGKNALAVVTDVAKTQDCTALLNAAVEKFGQIDGLVNNAGFNSRGAVEAVALEAMEQIIEVNLKAPIRLSKMVLPQAFAQQPAFANQGGLGGPQNFGMAGASTAGAVAQPNYGQPTYGQPAASGLGGRIMGGVATGLAVGAGVMAAEAIGRNLMGNHNQPTRPADTLGNNDSQPLDRNTDMGGQNFGINDSSSWDDGSSIDVGGDGWDN